MQNSKEQLASAHPFFRIPSTQIFWFEQVLEKTNNQSSQQRYLAIASPGIFLFDRRTFTKGLVINQIIPYSELVLIRVDSQSTQFFKAKVTLSIQNCHHYEAAAIVIAIRNSLFGEKPRATKILIDPQVQEEVNRCKFNFESSFLLADRFLSLCLNLEEKTMNVDQISSIYTSLQQSKSKIQIDTNDLNSPYFIPLTLSIAYDGNIKSLVLKNVNFSTVANSYASIVKYNSSLQNIYFTNVSFSGSIQPYLDVFKDKTFFSAYQYYFKDCKLTTSDFVSFFKSFKKYPADMFSLVFSRCTFTTLAMETIFSTIANSVPFRTLRELYFGDMKADESLTTCLLQFFTSNFFINQKNLASLSFESMGMDLNMILSFLFLNNSYFLNLSLAGNKLLTPVEIKDFKEVKDLNLSCNEFTGESLIGLLTSISTAKNSPSNLTLDNLILPPSDFMKVFDFLPSLVIPNLKMISFSGNQINAQMMSKFSQFLLRQPNLTDLGLSSSLTIDEIDSTLPELITLLKTKPIRKLELRGIGNTVLGKKLLPLLKELPNTLEMLDITGQQIGDECLDVIAHIISERKNIEEIHFDGNEPSSLETLFDFLNKLMESKIYNAEWPEIDTYFCLNKIKNNFRPMFVHQIEEVKKLFVQRFPQTEFTTYPPLKDKLNQMKKSVNELTAPSPRIPREQISSVRNPPFSIQQTNDKSKSALQRNSLSSTSPTNSNNMKLFQQASVPLLSSNPPNSSDSSHSQIANNLSLPQLPSLQWTSRIFNRKIGDSTQKNSAPEIFNLNVLEFIEPAVENAIEECLKINDSENYAPDPLVKIFKEMNDETSISVFLQQD